MSSYWILYMTRIELHTVARCAEKKEVYYKRLLKMRCYPIHDQWSACLQNSPFLPIPILPSNPSKYRWWSVVQETPIPKKISSNRSFLYPSHLIYLLSWWCPISNVNPILYNSILSPFSQKVFINIRCYYIWRLSECAVSKQSIKNNAAKQKHEYRKKENT